MNRPAPAVVPIRDKLMPIQEQLRQWADDMDAGRIPVPLFILFMTDDGEGYGLRAVGEMTNARAAHMLFRALSMVAE